MRWRYDPPKFRTIFQAAREKTAPPAGDRPRPFSPKGANAKVLQHLAGKEAYSADFDELVAVLGRRGKSVSLFESGANQLFDAGLVRFPFDRVAQLTPEGVELAKTLGRPKGARRTRR